MSKLNRTSGKLTEDISLPAARAMLHGAGLRRADMGKAQVGIGSTFFESNTCNMHLAGLAGHVKRGVEKSGLVGWLYNTIGVSDGITNGTEGMRYSLPSRELIADSIETMVGAHYYDGHVAVVGCDKNMPGAVMAMARLDRPAIMVYGGTIKSGILGDKKLDIISAFEAYGQFLAKQITEAQMNEIVEHACPGPGACGGMYTANTMASAIETMGMSLPFSSSTPAEDPGKARECEQVGEAMRVLLEKNLTPRQIMTRRAFDNAITMVIVLGGSTNAVIHLIAMARAAGVELTIDDFKALNDKIPVLADLRPSGKFSMEDLCHVGGVPAVQKLLLQEGLLDGNCVTCTGKTLAENVAAVPALKDGQKIIAPVATPVKATGHIRVLRGNLAPTGAVAKITGKEGLAFKGPARVFDSEDDAIKGVASGKVKAGDVIAIRYEGPKGGPGMPEMLRVTAAVMGAGLGKSCAMITDGRFSGGSHGFVIGHITPEAQDGGPIALLADGDVIAIDAVANTIDLEVDAAELERRRGAWSPRPLRVKRGALLKYAKLVKDASSGCVTDE